MLGNHGIVFEKPAQDIISNNISRLAFFVGFGVVLFAVVVVGAAVVVVVVVGAAMCMIHYRYDSDSGKVI